MLRLEFNLDPLGIGVHRLDIDCWHSIAFKHSLVEFLLVRIAH
jgi:hypothetical protein